jgi:sugar lactone lactonase YvrE
MQEADMHASTLRHAALQLGLFSALVTGCSPINLTVRDINATVGDVNAQAHVNAQTSVGDVNANVNTGGTPGAPGGTESHPAEAAPTPAPTPRAYEGVVSTIGGTVRTGGNMIVDPAGRLLFVDADAGEVKRMSPTGEVETVARLQGPGARAIARDAEGTLYVTEPRLNQVWRIAPGGEAVPFLGGSTVAFAGYEAGTGLGANIGTPTGLLVDAQGRLVVAASNRLYRVSPEGQVTLLVGDRNLAARGELNWAEPGYADGWDQARFDRPTGLAQAANGVIVLADLGNGFVRRVDEARQAADGLAGGLKGLEPGFAEGRGGKAQFHHPSAVAVDHAGYVYVADTGNHRIRRVAPDGTTTTLAGGAVGHKDGQGAEAAFNGPTGIALGADGTIYVADAGNQRIRAIR